MELEVIITQLEQNAQVIRTLVQMVSDDEARRKPNDETWSILEVVNHLADEEIEDFRARLDFVLQQREGTWPGTDPMGWVTERAYNQRDLGKSLRRWLDAREASLAWLRTLDKPDWEASYEAHFGLIRAGDILVSWVAHDLEHLRQLTWLHAQYVKTQATPYSVLYAGEWTMPQL